jgi:hypothetical protein
MSTYNIPQKVLLFALLCISTSAFAGETTKYTGTVYATPVKHLMPLGNGDAVLVIELAGIVALSDKPPTLGALVCTGMGLQKVDNTTATDFYCNIKQNNADSFDFKGNAAEADGKSKGTFNIVGGSGKWAGATGKGKFKRVSESDVGTKTVIEIEITAK